MAGKYTGPIVVDPLTRIEGHLRIEVEVENGVVKDAHCSSTLFRGLEPILMGRDPRDAQHITQRACGVCTYTHSLASTRALEDATKTVIPKNATYIRNLILGSQVLHDHVVHFYHLHALDFVDITSALKADPQKAAKLANSISPRQTKAEDLKAVQQRVQGLVDSGQLGPFTNAYFLGGHPAYKLEPEVNLIATAHYLDALRAQVEAARAIAVFGGKNPHPQFLLAGGVSCYEALTPEAIAKFEALWRKTKSFVEEVYLPDVLAIGAVYKDVAGYGAGTKNYLAFGDFPTDELDLNSRDFKPGAIFSENLNKVEALDIGKITEHVRHSWYKGDTQKPATGTTEPMPTKMHEDERYSWSKAPRYADAAFETGPLAQVMVNYVNGHKVVKPIVDKVLATLGVGPEALASTLGRTAGRCIETVAVATMMDAMLTAYKDNVAGGDKDIYVPWEIPKEAEGVGLANVCRGGLGHWIRIEDSKIANFQLVVPTTWNISPRCANNKLGPMEAALVGSPIEDPKRPVEILRTVHSFDPCSACAVHIIDPKSNEVHKFRVL